MGLGEWMEEKQPVTRWKVFFHFLCGVFSGAVLMFMFALAGLV